MKKVFAWMGRHWIITGLLAGFLYLSFSLYDPATDTTGMNCIELEAAYGEREAIWLKAVDLQSQADTLFNAAMQTADGGDADAMAELDRLQTARDEATEQEKKEQRRAQELYLSGHEQKCPNLATWDTHPDIDDDDYIENRLSAEATLEEIRKHL